MAIEIVDLPIQNGDFPISYVNVYQRVSGIPQSSPVSMPYFGRLNGNRVGTLTLAVNHLNKFQAASCQHLLHQAAGQWLEATNIRGIVRDHQDREVVSYYVHAILVLYLLGHS